MDDWRDLGGTPTADGRTLRPGALVRARSLDHLDARDWAAIHALGVRTSTSRGSSRSARRCARDCSDELRLGKEARGSPRRSAYPAAIDVR